jgi:hypothetical protein
MASAFKNFQALMTTAGVTSYTCPASTKAIVLHLQIANIDGTNPVDATVYWTDSSNSNAIVYLAKIVTVYPKQSISAVTGKLVLEAGDTIVGISSADNKLQLSGSVLEVS